MFSIFDKYLDHPSLERIDVNVGRISVSSTRLTLRAVSLGCNNIKKETLLLNSLDIL